MSTFAERLKELREDCELTQERCSERCGFKPSAWSRWESTDEEPNTTSLRKIASGLELGEYAVGWLVVGESDSNPTFYSSDVREALIRIRDEALGLVPLVNQS